MKQSLFGSPLRTKALVVIGALEETYVAELARILGVGRFAVQRVVMSLEDSGAVAARKRGSVTLISLNRRWFAFEELNKLLLKISDNPDYDKLLDVRRRPRKIGKKL